MNNQKSVEAITSSFTKDSEKNKFERDLSHSILELTVVNHFEILPPEVQTDIAKKLSRKDYLSFRRSYNKAMYEKTKTTYHRKFLKEIEKGKLLLHLIDKYQDTGYEELILDIILGSFMIVFLEKEYDPKSNDRYILYHLNRVREFIDNNTILDVAKLYDVMSERWNIFMNIEREISKWNLDTLLALNDFIESEGKDIELSEKTITNMKNHNYFSKENFLNDSSYRIFLDIIVWFSKNYTKYLNLYNKFVKKYLS